jgi:hypothetical protein
LDEGVSEEDTEEDIWICCRVTERGEKLYNNSGRKIKNGIDIR